MIDPIDRVLFKFKAEDGSDASVILSRVRGFGEQWPSVQRPMGTASVIEVGEAGCDRSCHIASSEPISILEIRFAEQLTRIWDKDKANSPEKA